MGRRAHAQSAYDIGQKIAQHTLRGSGSKISSTYLSGLTSARKSYYSRLKEDYNKPRDVTPTSYMDFMRSRASGGYVNRSTYRAPLQRDRGTLQDWLGSSGQNKLLGKKGATIVLRERVKSYAEAFGQNAGAGPGPDIYNKSLESRGLTPGDYQYSTISFSKDYSYNKMKADAASQAYHSKKARKKSGIGGILGMVIGTTKRVLKDPSRIFTGIDPVSTKLGNAVFGTDKTPIVNLMGGPSESSYKLREEETGRKTSRTTRGFFTMADMIAGIWGGGAAAAAVGGAAGAAAGGAGTIAGDVAAAAASSAVKGAVSAAVQTGGEDLTAVGKGAVGGAVTGTVKGLAGFYMGGAGSTTSAGTGGTTTSEGKDMSLWDQISDYYTTDEGGYDWGNIAGTALKAYGAYSAYQGGKAQQDTARQAAALGQDAYQFSRAQQEQQFGLAEMTLANRMQQQQAITGERGAIRDEMRGQLQINLDHLSGRYKTAYKHMNLGRKAIEGARDASRSALQPMIGESDIARRQQMGLLGIGGYTADLAKTPGYQFRMQEAMQGAQRGLASTGGSRSGRAAIELQGRAEGLAGQYFDTHLGQLGQFAQAGIGARGQLAGLERGYGQDLMSARAQRANLAQTYAQTRAGVRTDYSRMQASLVPRADMFNSQFGQLSSGMAGAAMGGLQQYGQAQLNYGGGMGGLYSQFGGELMDMYGKGVIG